MGLLDYADLARKKLKGLLGEMPLVQMAQGRAEMPTKAGLFGALKAMPVFSPDAGESAYEAAMNIGPMGLGKIVYHGSPHKFDKFDASKIGTGEGAQAYGHGVYLADSPEVAGGYARALGGREFDVGGKKIYTTSSGSTRVIDQQAMPEKIAADALDDAFNAQSSSPAQFAANRLRQQRKLYPEQAADIDAAMNVIADWQASGSAQQITGQTYKADLPDEWIPKMLDWDKPLSEQPEVLKALEKHPVMGKDSMGWRGAPPGQWERAMNAKSRTGEWLYREIANNNPAETALALQSSGIPGIRYLDGGSRGKGQGSYNYVVFPGLEDQVKILERNGIQLSGLLGGQ